MKLSSLFSSLNLKSLSTVQIRKIFLPACVAFFIIIVLLYKVIFYTPPLLDTGQRNFLELTIDFFSFGWHATKGSILNDYLHKPSRAKTQFAKAGWYRSKYLEKRFGVDRATRKVASDAIKKTMDLSTENPMLFYFNGLQKLLLKQYAEAKAELERFVDLQPEFADAYFRLGLIAEEENDLIKAKSLYEKTVELLPNHLEGLKALREINKKIQ